MLVRPQNWVWQWGRGGAAPSPSTEREGLSDSDQEGGGLEQGFPGGGGGEVGEGYLTVSRRMARDPTAQRQPPGSTPFPGWAGPKVSAWHGEGGASRCPGQQTWTALHHRRLPRDKEPASGNSWGTAPHHPCRDSSHCCPME